MEMIFSSVACLSVVGYTGFREESYRGRFPSKNADARCFQLQKQSGDLSENAILPMEDLGFERFVKDRVG